MPQAPAPVQIVAEPVEGMEIVHDDDDIVVIMKPVGVAAHPSPGWSGHDRDRRARRGRLPDLDLRCRRAPGHRPPPRRRYVGPDGRGQVRARVHHSQAQFRERTVDKRYHALVQGHPDPLSGTIDAPIGRHPQHDYKWAVTAEGKPSVTHYDLIEAFRAASLLDIKLETGRTHQIRVHMAAHRHPCVGDLTYGADPTLAKRLKLEPAVAARGAARLRAPVGRELGGVREHLPGGPAAGAGHRSRDGERVPASGAPRGLPYEVRVAEGDGDRDACFAVRKEVFVGEQGVPAGHRVRRGRAAAPCTSWPSATTGRWVPGGCCTARRPRRGPAVTSASACWAASP